MNQGKRKPEYRDHCMNRPWATKVWKRSIVLVIAAVMVLGLSGCKLDDLLLPFDTGEIPFETEPAKPTDMGEVDNKPATREDDCVFDDLDAGI